MNSKLWLGTWETLHHQGSPPSIPAILTEQLSVHHTPLLTGTSRPSYLLFPPPGIFFLAVFRTLSGKKKKKKGTLLGRLFLTFWHKSGTSCLSSHRTSSWVSHHLSTFVAVYFIEMLIILLPSQFQAGI